MGFRVQRTLSSNVHESWEWRHQTRSTSRRPLQYVHGVGRTSAPQILLKGFGTRACQDPRGACWAHDWRRAGMSLDPVLFRISMHGKLKIKQVYWICCIEVLTKPAYVLNQEKSCQFCQILAGIQIKTRLMDITRFCILAIIPSAYSWRSGIAICMSGYLHQCNRWN